MAAPDAQAADTQARHGAFLSNALKDLAGDVNELDSLVPDKATADAPRTRPHFAPFLVSRTSPTWPQVKAALISTFSSVVEPDLRAVEPGPSGMAAVLFVLEIMVDWEADRNSVRQTIYSLSTAVSTTTESIRSASSAARLTNLAQAELQQALEPTVHQQPARLAAATNTREPSIHASTEQRNATPGPSGLSSVQIAALAERAAPSAVSTRSTPRSARASPAHDPTATSTAISTRTRSARRASELAAGAAPHDAESSPPRKRLRRSEGRSPVAREVKRERHAEVQVEVGEAGVEEELPQPVALVQKPALTPTGSAVTVPLVSAFLSLPHRLLLDATTSMPLMDADTSALEPPPGFSACVQRGLVFARPHFDNVSHLEINPGAANGRYTRSRNTLTLKQEKNLCGLSGARALAPGQPLVFVSSRSKCLELLHAASRFHADKKRDGINVFVSEHGRRRLVYKGLYVPVRAASILLPRGPDARARLEPILHNILKGHCDLRNAKLGRAKDMLADWGFSGGVTSSDEVMQQLEGDCEEDRVMHYVAMRCVGWDDESFDEWSRRRDGHARR